MDICFNKIRIFHFFQICCATLQSFHDPPGNYKVGNHCCSILYVFLYFLLSANILLHASSPLLPLSSPSFTEVRYCISGRPFLTVSNAHRIPQVGGLRGLIGYNAFTYTKGLREEITFRVCPDSAPHIWVSTGFRMDGNLVVHKASNRIQSS